MTNLLQKNNVWNKYSISLIKIQQVFKKIIENIYNNVSIHK